MSLYGNSYLRVVLFIVMCGVVWFRVLLWCLFDSYWKITFRQLQIKSIIYASTLKIWKHGYFDHLDFIILFVGILSLSAINLVLRVCLQIPFTFLALLNILLYVMYYINLNERISFCFCQKLKKYISNIARVYIDFVLGDVIKIWLNYNFGPPIFMCSQNWPPYFKTIRF